ncbi:hypothetical protein BDQ17DRAFT_1337219 [Cyathus striatus]|nr:hypothetical protein BDQ17DRAFT_1337219 [Cyathus striatus]
MVSNATAAYCLVAQLPSTSHSGAMGGEFPTSLTRHRQTRIKWCHMGCSIGYSAHARESQVNEVADECKQLAGLTDDTKWNKILWIAGDFAEADDAIKLLMVVETDQKALDVLIFAARTVTRMDDDVHNGVVMPQATQDERQRYEGTAAGSGESDQRGVHLLAEDEAGEIICGGAILGLSAGGPVISTGDTLGEDNIWKTLVS